MKIDPRQPCPVCKFNPQQLACDGTKIGVGFRNINFQEISQPDDEVNIKPTIHRRMTRCLLAQMPDVEAALIKEAREHLHYISRLNEIPIPEMLPVIELSNRNALLLSLLDESVKPVFVRFLDGMSLDERLVFANVVKMLASTAPVNSLIPYVYATSLADLTDHLAGDKFNEDGDVFFTRKMLEMREYAPEIRDLIATSMISNISENGDNYLPRDIILFIRYLIKFVCDMRITPPDPPVSQSSTYNPPKFGSAYYFSSSGQKLRNIRTFSIDCESKKLAYDDPPSEHDRCEKYYSKTNISAPGTSSLFLWFCPNHGHCYGFHMTKAEGRKDPYASLYAYLENPPRDIFYDFSCNLQEYCLNRESGFFGDIIFVMTFSMAMHINAQKHTDLHG